MKSNASGRGFSVRVLDANGQLRDSALPLLRELLLENRIVLEGSECWFWSGGHDRGYGWTRMGGKNEHVHRLAFKVFKGPIPPGMFICHHCDRPGCWNPDHLFLGTPHDNVRDMIQKGRGNGGSHQKVKTHCPSGHEYTDLTTTIYQGRRYCRLCHRKHSREYVRRKTNVKNPRILTDD